MESNQPIFCSGIRPVALGWDLKSRGVEEEVGFEPGARKKCRKLPLQELPQEFPARNLQPTAPPPAPNSLVRGNLIFVLCGTNEVFSKYLFTRILSGADSGPER